MKQKFECGAITQDLTPCKRRVVDEWSCCYLHGLYSDDDDECEGDSDIYGEGEFQISYDSAMYRN